jgi:hypothetical protein
MGRAATFAFLLLLTANLMGGQQTHSSVDSAQTSSPTTKPGFLHRPILSAVGHLPEWLARHQNLPVAQQEMLLRRNAEFRQMAPQAQQRVMDQLHRIDQMSAAQRERYLARNEAIERLSPEERADFQASLQAVNRLTPDRRAAVAVAFRSLRRYPEKERVKLLAAAPYSSSLTVQERTMLGSLLKVEPYLPQQAAPALKQP